ncbi:hypothetical protein AXJ14_gp062 [Geobacillus virus E3]|uniref:hypothetical protein n=1 Tax=Geobacillus virus E3 TaxID=1572712 RepID=UPI000671A58B|nr:hypothetical protein AXJ14_gp062 [Geobacillus virus E3]AJA41381.1 hypothetical protein E3_062 [Geobacillus virus E3]
MNYTDMNNHITLLTIENFNNYNEFIQEMAEKLVKNYFPLDKIETFDELSVFKTVFMDNFIANIQAEVYSKVLDLYNEFK